MHICQDSEFSSSIAASKYRPAHLVQNEQHHNARQVRVQGLSLHSATIAQSSCIVCIKSKDTVSVACLFDECGAIVLICSMIHVGKHGHLSPLQSVRPTEVATGPGNSCK